MTRAKLINAFNMLAEAAALVAIELEAQDQPAAEGAPSGNPPQRASAPAPLSVSIDQCPAHHREWKAGKYGPFCTAQSDDPAWSNDRGYCTINPKNAPDWLRVQAA